MCFEMGAFANRWNELFADQQPEALKIPRHRIEEENAEGLVKCLTNFDFLLIKLSNLALGGGVSALIADFSEGIEFLKQDTRDAEGEQILSLVRGALGASASFLETDPTRLAEQLWGRLNVHNVPAVQRLLNQIVEEKREPWLCPVSPILESANSAEILTLKGHVGYINSIVVATDGEKVISCSSDNTLILWNVKTGNKLSTFGLSKLSPSYSTPSHHDAVMDVALAPSGQFAISASKDKTLIIWDLDKNEFLLSILGHSDSVNSVAISSDEQFFISGSSDCTVKIWNLKSGKEVCTFSEHKEPVSTVAVTKDGKYIVSGSHDRTVKVWNVNEQNSVYTFSGHSNSIRQVFITPDDQRLIVNDQGSIRVYDFINRTQIYNLPFSESKVTLTSDGKYLITGVAERVVYQGVDVSSILAEAGLDITTGSVQYIPDSHIFRLDIFDVTTGARVGSIPCNVSALPNVIAVTPNGKNLITGSNDLTLWDFKIDGLRFDSQVKVKSRHQSIITDLAITPDGKKVVSVSFDGHLRVSNLRTAEELFSINNPKDSFIQRMSFTGINLDGMPSKILGHEMTSLALTASGKVAVTGLCDGSIRVWNLETYQEIKASIFHNKPVRSVALSLDNRWLVSSSDDCTVKLLDLQSGIEAYTLSGQKGHKWYVNAVIFTPDSRMIISGSHDKTIKVWSVDDARLLFTLTGHTGAVTSLSITRDGQYITSGSKDHTVRVWSLEQQCELAILSGHTGAINTVQSTFTNRLVVSTSLDQTLKVWDWWLKEVVVEYKRDRQLTACTVALDGLTISIGSDRFGMVESFLLSGLDSYVSNLRADAGNLTKPELEELFSREIALFQRVVKEPDFDEPETWNGRGEELYAEHQYQEAIVCFEKAIKRKPDFHQALYNAARAYAVLDQVNETIQYLEKIVVVDAENYIKKIQEEAAFDSVSRTRAYKMLIQKWEYSEAKEAPSQNVPQFPPSFVSLLSYTRHITVISDVVDRFRSLLPHRQQIVLIFNTKWFILLCVVVGVTVSTLSKLSGRSSVSTSIEEPSEILSPLSPAQEARNQALYSQINEAGINSDFLFKLVNEIFNIQHPELRGEPLSRDPEHEQLREMYDKLASDVIKNLENIHPDVRRYLGEYNGEDYNKWQATIFEDRYLVGEALDRLANARFDYLFPEFIQKESLDENLLRVWYTVVAEQYNRIYRGDALEQITIPARQDTSSVSGKIADGNGKAYIAYLKEGQTITITLNTLNENSSSSPLLLSIFAPEKLTLLDKGTVNRWKMTLLQSGYYNFVISPSSSNQVNFEMQIGLYP